MKSNQILFFTSALSLGLFASCAEENNTVHVKEIAGYSPEGTTVFGVEASQVSDTAKMSKTARQLLTKMQRAIGGGGKFQWTADDHLWVERQAGEDWVQEISNDIPAVGAPTANFYYSGTYSNETYPVFYNGTVAASGSPKKVEIKTEQVQAQPNDFSHMASSGDCGYALARRYADEQYKFNIKHFPIYLCFLPRTTDPKLEGAKILRVEANTVGQDFLSGNFGLTATGLVDIVGFAYSSVAINAGANQEGFVVNATNDDTNPSGYYAVAHPGNHMLRVKYTVRAQNGAEYKINRVINNTATNYESGKVYEITTNLRAMPNGLEKYYTWDAAAQDRYFYADEPGQIVVYPDIDSDRAASVDAGKGFAKSTAGSSDSRAANNLFQQGTRTAATRTAANSPTYNQLTWILWAAAQSGNGIFFEKQSTFNQFGGTYKGGFWLPKKSKIMSLPGYNGGADMNDYPAPSFNAVEVKPLSTLPNANDYFFVPANGYIETDGTIRGVGNVNRSWASHAYEQTTGRAYSLTLEFTTDAKKAELTHQSRGAGLTLWRLQ